MMQAVHAIEGVLSLFLLAAIIYGPWQWVCTDLARQKMFADRDALFDLARQGKMDFDSNQYRDIRDKINSQIRFAHDLTWIRLAVFATSARRRPRSGMSLDEIAMTIPDQDVRLQVQTIVADVKIVMVRIIVAKSPLIILLLIGTIVPAMSYLFTKGFLSKMADRLGGIIQTEADYLRS